MDSNKKQPEAGKKYDGGKAPMVSGLLNYFPRALKEVALQSLYGHIKYEVPYEDQNWSRVENGIARYDDANVRHIVDRIIEGNVDRESGEAKRLHRVAQAWDALAALELFLREEEANDK